MKKLITITIVKFCYGLLIFSFYSIFLNEIKTAQIFKNLIN